jgi:hypothetical protein
MELNVLKLEVFAQYTGVQQLLANFTLAQMVNAKELQLMLKGLVYVNNVRMPLHQFRPMMRVILSKQNALPPDQVVLTKLVA